ncbi:MAG TPA: AAA family ATPase [Longimicrobiales bacterium]|nr:AAA family ATPase [Longimicrobiales bacterium]
MISTGSRFEPAFVGRHRELAAFSAALQDAHNGRGGLLLLIGEAGVGKTRTAEEGAALAARGGFRVWWGHCHEDQGMPPYWPWMELLRCCLRDDATADAARRAGVAAQLAELVPDLIARKPSGRSSPSSDDAARFRLFHAVASTLEQAAGQVPILAVIEDLHWSDEASAALLTFVARRAASSRLLLLGTCRDEALGSGWSTSSLAASVARTLPLDGLARDEVEALFTAMSQRYPDAALLAALHHCTGGNPFFITEIARWMTTSPAAPAGSDAPLLRIPASVWSVIRRRLDQLPDVTRRTMQAAAALGSRFEIRLLQEACDDEIRGALPVALAEAVAGRVIQQDAESAFTFRHPLIRQALYEEIAPAARMQLHGRIADAYRAATARGADSSASEIAHHLARAGPERDADLAHYSRLAGEQALATCAYAEAVGHFERVLRATTHVDAQSAAMLVSLGRALAATSLRWNRQRAWEHVSRAVQYYVACGSIAKAVAAATDASLMPEGVGRITPTLTHLLEAVSPDSVEAGWLHARHGAAIFFETGDYERARGQLMRALALARGAGDAALELRTLSYATSIDHFAVRWHGLLAECHRVIELARRVDDPHAETYARYRAAYTLAFSGQPAEARLQARLNVAQAERLADPGLLADALYVRMSLAQTAGDWDAARELAARGLQVSPHHLPILQLRTVLEFETGNEAAGRLYLDRLCDAAANAGPYPLRGGLHALALAQIADLRAEQFLQPAAESSPIPMAVLLSHTLPAAFAAVRENDRGRAAAAMTALAPYAGIIIATPQVTDRLLGRLAAAAGDDVQAARHYEDALAFCRRAAYHPELAWTCHDYARFLLTRSRSRLNQTAGALTLEAHRLATSLGMPPLLKRVEALQAEQGELSGEGPGSLTPREFEILRLISTGQTNKAIAKQLDISRHTVAVHVSRILAKTGARNRTEAALVARTSLPE